MTYEDNPQGGVFYRGTSGHTMELGKLHSQYAEAYDAWEKLQAEVDEHMKSAETKQKQADQLKLKVEELGKKIKELFK